MKKQKFEAIQRELWIPDNHHFYDLGESDNFRADIYRFHKHELKIPEDQLMELLSEPKLETVAGYFQNITFPQNYTEQKCAFIIYRTKEFDFGEGIDSLAGQWYARGHEEGHVLMSFGLKDAIDEIIGKGILDLEDKSREDDREAISDLLGLYAVDIRGLGSGVSPERRKELERAKRWLQYQKDAEERYRKNSAKKEGITTVMSVYGIVEMKKRLESR
ncbi:hypothetical protein KY343_04290 [Candidatus Woesearchaeota archaeon]|nr:hypothetical protein [Candidatus Woesearchaeota archaeon]